MKKLLSIAFAALAIITLATSCCNCDKECCKKGDKKECTNEFKKEHGKHHGRPDLASEQECGVERKKCNPEMKEMFEKWMNFDSLSAEEQAELVAKKKQMIDEREARMKAHKDSFEAKWANFDNLSTAEKKQVLDEKERMCVKGHNPMGGCFGKGPKDGHGPNPHHMGKNHKD